MALNRKVGEMSYDNLIAGISPATHVSSGTIRALAAETVLERGTLLAKSDRDNALVILGTTEASSESAVDPTYAQTEDEEIVDGKSYYTESGGTYTLVDNPVKGSLNSYYEMTDPGSPAYEKEVLAADAILTDDVLVGTTADVVTTVYTAGNFNLNALIVKDNYTITEADKDELRKKGIYLSQVLD